MASVTVAVQSKSQLAYDFVKARIENSSYTPGYRLVLGAIAGELGVSVVPVREAIRRLEAEGLVQFERNVGAQVAMVDPREYEVTMQTLSLVEGWATAASAPFMTPDDVARARAINDQLTDTLHHFDPVAFTRLNLEFHSVLFEHCPNPHIRDLVDRGWARLRALRESTFSFVPGRARESVAEHERILDLIEGGADARDLEFAARNHRLATLEAFLEHEVSRGALRDDRFAIPQGTREVSAPQGTLRDDRFAIPQGTREQDDRFAIPQGTSGASAPRGTSGPHAAGNKNLVPEEAAQRPSRRVTSEKEETA